MTLEELLGLSSKDIESIPPAQIQSFFEQYLNVTRPERVVHEPREKKRSVAMNPEDYEKNEKMKKFRAMAEQMGMKI